MNEDTAQDLARGQTKTACEQAVQNIELVRHDLAKGRVPGPALIQGLRYAARILFQAVECLEGRRDYIEEDVELELKNPLRAEDAEFDGSRDNDLRTTCKEDSCKCFCHVTGVPQGDCCGRERLTRGSSIRNPTRQKLNELIEQARKLPPPDEEMLRLQRVSWVYGQSKLAGLNVTREEIEEIERDMNSRPPSRTAVKGMP